MSAKSTRGLQKANVDIDENDTGLNENNVSRQFIGSIDVSTDDDGSITYVQHDYEMNEDPGSEEQGFLIEYVNEDDEMELDELEQVDDEQQQQVAVEEEEDNDHVEPDDTYDDLYNCNLCGMDFKDIKDHIKKYHPDQEVIVDIPDKVGTVIKQEEPLDYEETDYATDHNNGNAIDDMENESELITFGDDPLAAENNDYLEVFDEDVDTEVYTYDQATGSITKTSKLATNKSGINNNKSSGSAYNCTRCNEVFETLRALSSHLLSAHEKEIAGTSGKQKFVGKPTVKGKAKNIKQETAINPTKLSNDYTCDTCNTIFQSAKSLKLHARMHLPVKMKTLEEAAEHELDTIPISETDDSREKFYCAICGKWYNKTFEEVHIQMHNGKEKFNCVICNKLFPNEESISMHMNAHQESRVIKTKAELKNIKLPYGCQYCGKEFARPHEKVKHERVHTGEKPYECEICGKCFRVSYCLTIHMRTHTDARPYVCPHCNKRFKAQSVYNHHLLTHSDERNYKCPYCPKTFKTSVQLSGHKNSHTKPFSCTECNRPFGSLYAVRAHMESHKRPNHNLKHCCDICGAKYARRFALNDHMKEQHKDVQVVQIVDATKVAGKRSQPKRTKKAQPQEKRTLIEVEEIKESFISDDEERELEAAGQSILPNVIEHEITIDQIEQFENEEEVVGIDWLK